MTQTISPFVDADYNPNTQMYTARIDECLKCGCQQTYITQDADQYYRMRELGYCDDCAQWYDLFCRMQFYPHWWQKVIANGRFYHLHLEDKRRYNSGWLVLSNNGKRAMSYNMHMVGKIPALWRPLFPDNARFIGTMQQDQWYFEDPDWPAQPYRKPVF